MKRIIVSLAVAALAILPQSLNAQTVRTDLHAIDSATFYAPITPEQYTAIYIVPVDESVIVYDEKDHSTKKVKKEVAAFRSHVKRVIEKNYKNIEVNLVDEVPAELAEGELVLSIRFTEFDLGSSAARFWSGFAGGAIISAKSEMTTVGGEKLFDFLSSHYLGINPFAPSSDKGCVKFFEEGVGKNVVTIFKKVSKE